MCPSPRMRGGTLHPAERRRTKPGLGSTQQKRDSMPTFEYMGQLRSGQAISGTIEAEAIEQARGQLDAMGIGVTSMAAAPRMRVPRPLSREDIIFFNQQLAS